MKHQHECIYFFISVSYFIPFSIALARNYVSINCIYNTNRLYKMLQAKIYFRKNISHWKSFHPQNIVLHYDTIHSVHHIHHTYPLTRNFKWMKYANCEILELMMMRSEKCFYFSISLKTTAYLHSSFDSMNKFLFVHIVACLKFLSNCVSRIKP